jgi:hypothetical protein
MADLENDKEGEKLVGKYIPIDPDPLKSLLLLGNQPLPSIVYPESSLSLYNHPRIHSAPSSTSS